MTFDHLPPPSLWRKHDEAHQAFYAELAQQPKLTRPRKRKSTLAGVARQAIAADARTPVDRPGRCGGLRRCFTEHLRQDD